MKTRFAVLGAMVLLASSSAWAVNCGPGQTKQHISVTSASDMVGKWSVYADLANGSGQKVHHWEETGKSAGSSTYWEYCDGHDNGRLYIWITPSENQKFSYLNLPLGQNHCYAISSPLVGIFSTVSEQHC
ncbi:hypothetical protein [Paracidovorax avenae]|uniref:hypothetical protein n=1 Tax=Paracidovorax avenae TaxID=80867 RepID=UPI0012487E89|nr:hypothetical protein [Paracidovorax avenae]